MINLATEKDYEAYYEYLAKIIRQDMYFIGLESQLEKYLEILDFVPRAKIFALEYFPSTGPFVPYFNITTSISNKKLK